jgi:single-stranded-DNA-specific exonuclease
MRSSRTGDRSLPLLERLLAARGFTDEPAARRFCEPKLSDLHDPSLLPGVEAAAARLARALRCGEPIAIYGDYDVDGISAAAILFHVLRTARPEAVIRTYVPHRLDEGYGLNTEALRQLRAEGIGLVVSVDCGITAIEPARIAREIGLDLVITDHHQIPPDQPALPEAAAIVHPGLHGDPALPGKPALPGAAPYPFRELCGAGVAFKLAWRFATLWCGSQRVSEALQKCLLDALPLAALGTIADVVPLLDENRILAHFGLRLMKETPIAGLLALIEAAGFQDEHIDGEKVGFTLAPRLNACGRMGHAAEALRMLTDASALEAAAIARKLTAMNAQRQRTERAILDRAARMAEDAGMTTDACRIIILAHESWHPGVVGIVCSRLVDRFGRPAVLLQRQGEVCRGSARSIDGYSIIDGLRAGQDHLLSCGGHEMAAGLSLRAAWFDAFARAVTEHANTHIAVEQLTPRLSIDCDATIAELDMDVVARLRRFSPFGRANPHPALRLTGVTVTEPPRQIGSAGQHLSLRVRDGAATGGRSVLRTVWWGAGGRAGDLAAGLRLDAVIEPKINEWNGRAAVEAELKDVRVLEPA